MRKIKVEYWIKNNIQHFFVEIEVETDCFIDALRDQIEKYFEENNLDLDDYKIVKYL